MRYLIIFIIALLINGCRFFQYSIYDDDVNSDYRNILYRNIHQIISVLESDQKKEFSFAIISDTHTRYKDLHDVISKINRLDNVDFTIILGDITDLGLKFEFENSIEEFERLKNPYLTVIGNHDYLSQGKSIYKQTLGETNLAFTANNDKFIFFDDVVWENDNKSPDFNWLKEEIESSNSENIFLFAHIPEDNNQMKLYRKQYENIISNCTNLYRFHGHTHHQKIEWPKITVDDIESRSILIISVDNENINFSFESAE
ncbi:MAG: metallophosphoesterase [Candidatus Delongbacteria bacterium]|nr:metallophosphoesterase [Candidatus Delongbacteria bacterium]MBN2834766.1 metallophosphoesterase [Candidatus Delongbacteria bacterium]